MISAGHRVDLYSYDDIRDLPPGVTLRDAAAIVDRHTMVRYREAGRFALFADVFRYKGLRQGLGIWCDADVLLLRNLSGMGETIMGWEDARLVGSAVLYLPPDSPFLKKMLRVASAKVPIPIHWPTEKKLKQIVSGFIGLHKPLMRLEWSVIGPQALTYYVKNSGLSPSPPEVFYPLPGVDYLLPFIPGMHLEDAFPPITRAVHLWHSKLKLLSTLPPQRGSFIARMCDKFGIRASDQVPRTMAASAVKP